jgi:hypothetical protein
MTDGPDARNAPTREQLTARIVDVVSAAIDVGAAVTRQVARGAVQGTRAASPQGEGIARLVRDGASVVGGVLGVVASEVGRGVTKQRAATQTQASPSGEAPSQGAPAGRPVVRAGSTLRVPLLVQNQESAPTPEMGFLCPTLERLDGTDARGPEPSDLRFVPPMLTVGPRDFEKLTVLVAVPPDATSGRYRAHIVGDPGAFRTALEFDVA